MKTKLKPEESSKKNMLLIEHYEWMLKRAFSSSFSVHHHLFGSTDNGIEPLSAASYVYYYEFSFNNAGDSRINKCISILIHHGAPPCYELVVVFVNFIIL